MSVQGIGPDVPHSSTESEASVAPALEESVIRHLTETFDRHASACQGGMQFSVYRAGSPLVSLRAGFANAPGEPQRPWDEKTLTVFFSGTKGLVATIAAIAVDRGLLDVDEPVATYWPEFAQSGKSTATVAQVLSHTVGLPYVDPDPSADTDPWSFLDSPAMAARLAKQPTLWDPGTSVAYHAITYGYLMSEIILRSTGRSVATWLREEVAGPLDLDLHLGLDPRDEARVAPVFKAPGYGISTYLKDDPKRRAIIDRMYSSIMAPTMPMNSREYHAAELSAGGGLGTADAMAKLYSILVTPGNLGGGLLGTEAMEAALISRAHGLDRLNDRPLNFGLGFELADPIGTYGPVAPAFGHSGAGGSLHGAWPERGLGFSFLSNEMQSEDVDRRAKDLLEVLAAGTEDLRL